MYRAIFHVHISLKVHSWCTTKSRLPSTRSGLKLSSSSTSSIVLVVTGSFPSDNAVVVMTSECVVSVVVVMVSGFVVVSMVIIVSGCVVSVVAVMLLEFPVSSVVGPPSSYDSVVVLAVKLSVSSNVEVGGSIVICGGG